MGTVCDYFGDFRPRGIIHAGAQFANEMEIYLGHNPDLIVWIEADPDKTQHISQAIQSRSHLNTHQIAIQTVIMDVDGPVVFNRYSNSGASSSIFRIEDNYNAEVLKQHGFTLDITARLELEGTRLDTALARAGIEPDQFDVMVLDLQGAELLALNSCGRYLDNVRFLEIEVSTRPVYEGGAEYEDIRAFVSELGFELVSTADPYFHGHCDAVYYR
jgi:FkbM family methyltransferase